MTVRAYVVPGTIGAKCDYDTDKCHIVLCNTRSGESSAELPTNLDPSDVLYYTLMDIAYSGFRANGIYRRGKAKITVQRDNRSYGERNCICDSYEGNSAVLVDLVELYYAIRAGEVPPDVSWDGPQVQDKVDDADDVSAQEALVRPGILQRIRAWFQRKPRAKQSLEPVDLPGLPWIRHQVLDVEVPDAQSYDDGDDIEELDIVLDSHGHPYGLPPIEDKAPAESDDPSVKEDEPDYDYE